MNGNGARHLYCWCFAEIMAWICLARVRQYYGLNYNVGKATPDNKNSTYTLTTCPTKNSFVINLRNDYKLWLQYILTKLNVSAFNSTSWGNWNIRISGMFTTKWTDTCELNCLSFDLGGVLYPRCFLFATLRYNWKLKRTHGYSKGHSKAKLI